MVEVHRPTVWTAAAGVHLLVFGALLAYTYLVPWEDESCADAIGFCMTDRDAVRILPYLGGPALIGSFVVAVALINRLGHRFDSAWTAGVLSSLAAMVIVAAVLALGLVSYLGV